MGKKITSTPTPKSKPKNISKKLQDEEPYYPEYGELRDFLYSLTDREKVLMSLCYSLSVADNHSGNETGKYLIRLYDETMKHARQNTQKLIGKPDLGHLAALADVIHGLTY